MSRHKTLFTTERGLRHQRAALDAAPSDLDVTMLRRPDRETLIACLADAEYWISERAGTIDAGLIAPRLALIQRLGALWYDIDLDAARAAGVAVCYQPVRGAIRVAEHLVMQMLALSKRLREAEQVALEASPAWAVSRRTDEDTFAYNWSKREGIDGLWERTVGILGLGEIGAELARRLRGWGCTVLYHKRHRLPGTAEAGLEVTYAHLEALAAASDVLVNLLPYAQETDGRLDDVFFATLKPGAYVVSCGSGSVIDEAALARAVSAGHVAGAALDTYEWEPIRADNPLLALARRGENVLLTPHVAAGTPTGRGQRRGEDYANILRHLAGRPLERRIA